MVSNKDAESASDYELTHTTTHPTMSSPSITVDELEVERMTADECPLVQQQLSTQCIQHRPADQQRTFRHCL